MFDSMFNLQVVGVVHSSLKQRADCPLQGIEGAPDAIIIVEKRFWPAIENLKVGEEIIVLTWMHLAARDVLSCYPRNEVNSQPLGVFSTRSPDRPNPIGLHRVIIKSMNAGEIGVFPIEVVEGTPVVDIKPVIKDAVS